MCTAVQYKQLEEDSAVSYLRAEPCIENPNNYSLEEKRTIVGDIDASDAAIDEAIKADFESMSSEAQAKMFELLTKASSEFKGYFSKLLLD